MTSICLRCKEKKSNTLFSTQQLKNLIVNRTCIECCKKNPSINNNKKVKTTPSLEPIQEELILLKIPKDIVTKIFTFLDYKEHFVLFGVSKHWNTLIEGYLVSLPNYPQFLQNWKGNRETLLTVLKKVTNIESVFLFYSKTHPFTQHHFINLSKITFQGLKYLTLSNSLITNMTPIIPLGRNLKTLCCCNCTFLNNIAALGGIAKYNKLIALHLDDNHQIPKDQFEVISKLTSLKTLSLRHLQLRDAQLSPLSTLTNLHSLVLDQFQFSASCVGSLLKHYPYLFSLNLEQSKMTSTENPEIIFQHVSTRITHLSLDFCDWVNDDVIKVLSRKLSYLESLTISGANQLISDQGCAVLAKLTQLRSLFLRGYNPLFSERGVEILTLNIPNSTIERI